MFDGTIKLVQDISEDDLLMGPDSQPRRVQLLGRGREMMYRIVPKRGDSYTVNESHILALQWCGSPSNNIKTGDKLNISVRDYLKLSNDKKRLLVGYRSGVDFSHKWNLPVDSYFLGLWLGDGSSKAPSITTADAEIVNYLTYFANSLGQKINVHGKNRSKCKTYSFSTNEDNRCNNRILSFLVSYGLLGNKHIPFQYITSDRESRLAILAGLLDSDGYLGSNGTSFEYVTKNSNLAKDVEYLVRSLGFASTTHLREKSVVYKHRKIYGDYYVIHISGNLTQIPTKIHRKLQGKDWSKRNPLAVGISVEKLEVGDYYGFQISGPDRLFLLGDFTVVHNTTLLDSIFWTMFGYLPKWGGPKGGPADAVIKRGKTKCSGTVLVEHAGKTIEITRQRPSKLHVKVDGASLEGKVSDLDNRIPELLGMNDKQFLLSVYMPQKRKDSFYEMSDSDRTQLLSVVAGLEELDAALNRAKGEKSRLQTEIDFLKGKISALEDNVSKYPDEIEFLSKKVSESKKAYEEAMESLAYIEGAAKEEIDRIEKKFKVLQQGIILDGDRVTSEHETVIRDLKEKYNGLHLEVISSPEVPKELLDSVDEAREKLSQVKQSHYNRDRDILKNERIHSKIAEELDLMEAAAQGRCNHCSQNLPEETKQAQAMRHLQNAKKLEGEIVEISKVADLKEYEDALEKAVTELNLKKKELSERPTQLKAEMSILTKQMQSEQELIDSKRSANRKTLDAERSRLESEVSLIKQTLKDAESKITTGQATLNQSQETLDRTQKRMEQEKSTLNENRNKLRESQLELDEALDLIDLFGPKGFRTLCFEDLVSRISDRAGQLMSIMTEGLYSTRIEQNGENGKGEHRVVLRPVITRGGIEVSSDDLSGGAEATITLAYDVAISEAIAENSPLFLDEALDGLDSQGKSEAIRLVEEVGRTRPVFLVDHTNEIKSSVQNVILVTYKNDTSTLENGNEDSASASITG